MSTKANEHPLPPPPTVTPPLGLPPVPDLPDIDARTHALRQLGVWLCSLRYMRTMARGQPAQPFYLTEDRVFIEQPDNVEGLDFPAFGMLPGRGAYLPRGLGGAEPIDSTLGIAGPGTALIVPFDYQETFTLEGWGSKMSERRSLVAAVETAISGYEGTTDLRIVLPAYFNQVATFAIQERENIDDLDIVRGRRKVHLTLQLTVPLVQVRRFAMLQVAVQLGLQASLGLSTNVQRLTLAANQGGALGLKTLGVDEATARRIVKATLDLTPAQANAADVDYLFAVIYGLAVQNAGFETANGRPPYSGDGDTRSNLLPGGSP